MVSLLSSNWWFAGIDLTETTILSLFAYNISSTYVMNLEHLFMTNV